MKTSQIRVLIGFIIVTAVAGVEEKKRNVFTNGGIVLRSEPSVKGRPLATIPAGTEFNILSVAQKEDTIGGVVGSWIEAEYAGKRGFLFGGYTSNLPYPKNCESIKKYVFTNFSKKGDEVQIGIKPDEKYAPDETGKKIQNFDRGIVYTEINGYEHWEEQIDFPNAGLYEVYFITKQCEKEFASLDLKKHRTQDGLSMKKYRGSTSLKIETFHRNLVRVKISRWS